MSGTILSSGIVAPLSSMPVILVRAASLWAGVPLLVHDLADRPPAIGGPPQNGFLRAFHIRLRELQPDATQLLRWLEKEPDRLLARSRGTPSPDATLEQR